MNPKNLKYPYTWEQRRPMIMDKILFVPQYYDKHQEWPFPSWESAEIFGREAPVHIEYCTGNGAWIIERAIKEPGVNWVAVEKRFDRVAKIWSKMHNYGLTNLFIVYGEALTFSRFYAPASSFSAIYVNFPDPWPKEKHAKNRLFKPEFVTELGRLARPGAGATFVTDDAVYKEQICQVFLSDPNWSPSFPPPHFVTEWKGYGASYFGDLWQDMGKTIHYIQFENRGVRCTS